MIDDKTELELEGLREHGLTTETHSQLADSFVLGMRFAIKIQDKLDMEALLEEIQAQEDLERFNENY